ncbi:MAG: hypothetical protein E6Q39_00915 [Crocinitomicaceae bacterium]|nr:MAG: hypothetical protein E6Q39_00915 [Crocinitomicaceae bacterium]
MKWPVILLLILSTCSAAIAQQNHFFFKKLTVANGLNDGNVLAIARDNRGFMWFATRAGLNRYDGYSVKNYSYIAGDSTSLPPSLIRAMSPDSSGNFWVGHEQGLLRYDSLQDYFIPVKSMDGIWVGQIIPIDKQTIYLCTSKGLIKFDTHKQETLFYSEGKNAALLSKIYSATLHNKQLILATPQGLLMFNTNTHHVSPATVPLQNDELAQSVAVDKHNNFWLVTKSNNHLIKYNPFTRSKIYYSQYLESGNNTIANFTSLFTDAAGQVWITTQLNGLLYYDEYNDRFNQVLHNPLQTWTTSTNLHSNAWCNADGTIWIGGNNGVNYFNPRKNIFTILPVFNKDPDIRNRRVARVAVQDKNGILWFGSIDGLVRYNPATNEYREWNNREGKPPMLYFNSIRGLLCDENNNIWIATGKGINLYKQKEDKMIFFSGNDSIPEVFYFSADKDRNGNYWFASRDADGFYYYHVKEKKFYSIRNFPGLNKYTGIGARKFYQDSKGRYWLGFNGAGLAMYDPRSNKHIQWQTSLKSKQSISGNMVVDIKEDRQGNIWVSTFTGLTMIDTQNFSVKNYNQTNGLVNNSIGPLYVDNNNRLWIGSGSGLMVLDSNRSYFSSFGIQNGLPSAEFPEHAASVLKNNEVLFPTQNGFIRFIPDSFRKVTQALTPYFTTLHISGKPAINITNQSIHLKSKENFFSIGFAAINFDNAAGNWYAYKLDGIDDDWKYTQNRFADYTNIAGGKYNFRIKASASREEWAGSETILRISIDTVFYNTIWFRMLLATVLLSAAYFVYRYRSRQKENLLQLRSKAQLLEKEKALVMYESLKQQLNPHFLFNSLSSLSGLIEADQKMAGNFLQQMSKIYRYILKSRDSELVSLKEEIDFVQTYIHLQKTRFGEGLQVNINVPEEYLGKKIVPVTLQNLLENALKHNVVDTDTPLIISIQPADDGYLEIKNNLQRKKMIETSNKQGLASLRSLYKYLSKKPIIIEETVNSYSIRIPLIEA